MVILPKITRILLCMLFAACCVSPAQGQSFMDKQLQSPVFKRAFEQKDGMLKKQFEEKGLDYPANFVFIRSFKYDSKLEVWVKNKAIDTFTLFKSYPVCALSGYMGRKTYEGDYQVPEGFYYINEFNPRSAYHLSLKINYPNFSDRLNTTHANPGGGIYIHGSCVTVGCIPITDRQMDEVYVLAVHAKEAGQNFIPVHILPIDFNNKKSVAYLQKNSKTDDTEQQFWLKLKKAFDYFNTTHKLPVVLYDGKGDYVIKEGRAVTPLKKDYSASNKAEHNMAPKSLLN